MIKKGRNKNKGKQQIIVVQPRLGLPEFDSTVRTQKVFRFLCSVTGDLDVTYARLGSLYLFATAATTSGLLWDRCRYKGVRVFGTTAPCSIAITHGGATTGIVGDSQTHSDDSIGSTYVAKLPRGANMSAWLKPPKSTQTQLWQICTQANTAIAFTLNNSVTGVIIDVHMEYAGPTKAGNRNNPGPTIAGATLGDVAFLGLDGQQASVSSYDPVGVTNIV